MDDNLPVFTKKKREEETKKSGAMSDKGRGTAMRQHTNE